MAKKSGNNKVIKIETPKLQKPPEIQSSVKIIPHGPKKQPDPSDTNELFVEIRAPGSTPIQKI
jgi:hypothetical protein